MTSAQTDLPLPRSQRPLRLWPGVVIALLMVLTRLAAPLVMSDSSGIALIGSVVGALLILLWWLLFSRAPWLERLAAIAVMAIGLVATYQIIHPSIRGAGMGYLFPILSIPTMTLALVAWAVSAPRLADGPRRVSMVLALLLASGAWALLRTGGISGSGESDIQWRWSETPEERLLAERAGRSTGPGSDAGADAADAAAETAADAAAAAAEAAAHPDWPGFRGPSRDSAVRGVRIATDWAASPPVELWRKPIGPGWSSFAVQGDFVYTQEQRGEEELVSCYNRLTGEPVWRHGDPVRFYESNAGPGPRATPTLSGGRVYTLGATGVVNALDARDGSVVWSRHAEADTGAKVPMWGFAGSPLVLDDLVIVATAGKLAAYDIATGEPRWIGPKGVSGYSSPHLLTLDGVTQVMLTNMAGATGVSPADGSVLWNHAWENDGIVQPALTGDGDILLGSGSGLHEVGTRRLAVTRHAGSGSPGESTAWAAEARWTSTGLKPYFNDFVVHEGHAYGFDGSILSCIDVRDGERRWKGGRYGHGQLVLLPDQDVLLVLSEQGELALVGATPEGHTELARHPAIKGKTWNHPVLAGDILLVRNAEEMAAFRLPTEGN
jgi:outer membrane protein assembly factor BamB